MATNNEKLLGVILGAGIGGYIANNKHIEDNNNGANYDIWHVIKGVFWGGLSGYGLATFFGSPNDTVNYTHYYKGKRVYEGITYADRFKKRMAEHRRSGKLFTRVVKDKPKPRIEALKLEKENIIRYKPSNNIQLNRK
ncbi:hypothetical protein [Flagellimonas onchidii]|uniref:hypothetical protein n=1 Tax=Flagellimonas onchidii TaxID=2562684 RepID=UPI0010A61E85|nr:hypothetical protein [Allomuricauda onchidii]